MRAPCTRGSTTHSAYELGRLDTCRFFFLVQAAQKVVRGAAGVSSPTTHPPRGGGGNSSDQLGLDRELWIPRALGRRRPRRLSRLACGRLEKERVKVVGIKKGQQLNGAQKERLKAALTAQTAQ